MTPSAMKLVSLVMVAANPDPILPETCVRSVEESAASVVYGQAEELRYEAKTADQHAASAERYASAARIIPSAELPRELGAKVVSKAHQEYKKAYLDAASSVRERESWRRSDQQLLERFVASYRAGHTAGDPCLGDGEFAEVALAEVQALSFESAADEGELGTAPGAVPPDVVTPGSSTSRSGRGLIIAGALTMGLGGAFIVWGPAQYAWRESEAVDPELAEPDRRDAIEDYLEDGRTIRTALLSVGGGLVVAGAIALGFGLAKRRGQMRKRVAIGAGTGWGTALAVHF